MPSRRHLVQDQSEGEDVAARVGIFAVEQLRRHVLRGAEDPPLLGELGGGRFLGRRVSALLGQAEVEQLEARLGDHDVARLQIAMNDSRAVRLAESVGDQDAVLQNDVERQRALGG